VRLLVASGEHHDRHLRACADPATDLEPVDAGEPDVEHDDADRLATKLRERLLPSPEPDHAPTVLLLEVLLDEPPERAAVLYEKESAPGCPRYHGLRIGGEAAGSLPDPLRADLRNALDVDGLGGTARRPGDENTPARSEQGGREATPEAQDTG